MPVAERAFGLDELLAAEEAFLTSSLRGLAPLVRVGDAGRSAAARPATLTRRSSTRLRYTRARRPGMRECELTRP